MSVANAWRTIRTEQGDVVTVQLHERSDGATAIVCPAGGNYLGTYIVPVTIVTGDGPDRLATPFDWEAVPPMTVAEALDASLSAEWWDEHRSQDATLYPTLSDVVRAVWLGTPSEVVSTDLPDGREWRTDDGRICFGAAEPDDAGTMLYTWATYERDGDGWEPVGDGGGDADDLRDALGAWAAEAMGATL